MDTKSESHSEEPECCDIEFRNPLGNKLVLENLFNQMSDIELMTARHVCKLWNQEANRFLRSRKLVNFSGSNTKHISSFLQLMKPYFKQCKYFPEDMIPFGRFSIQIWDSESFRSRFLSLPDYSEDFFNNYGQFVRYLQISFNDFKDTVLQLQYRDWFLGSLAKNLKILELKGLSSFVPTESGQFIFASHETVQVLPNLQVLIITDTFEEENEDADGEEALEIRQRFDTRFMSDLLAMAPNLQSLTVNTFENVSSSLTSSTVQVLKACPFTSQLQQLHLQTYINEAQLKLIHSCGFKLKSCELKYLDINMLRQSSTLYEFLVAQAATLQNLTLGLGRNDPLEEVCFCLRFPTVMPQLKSLSLGAIQLDICERSKREERGRDCRLMLPYLQNLSLHNHACLGQFCPAHQHRLLLHTLHLPCDFLDEETFAQILIQWKSLRVLKLEAPSHSMLLLLWKLGGAIEELELELSGDDHQIESILIGVDGEGSMANLAKIRMISISSAQPEPNSVLDITDDFVFQVIAKLKYLTRLTIRNSKISENGIQYIKENVKLNYFDVAVSS